MAHDPSNLQHRMNQALDQDLTEAELQALREQMAASTESAGRWKHMQRIDQLLRATPLAGPSEGFAARVMAAIERLHLDELADRQISVGVALGLMAAALLTVPLLSVALIFMASALTTPGTLAALLDGATAGTSYAIDLVSSLADALRRLATDTPMLPALASTVIPLSMLWLWMLWYLSGKPRVKAE